MLTTIRRTFALIGSESRGRWFAVLLLAIFASSLEVAGALGVFLLLGLVADPTGAFELPIVGDLRAFGTPFGLAFEIVVIGALAAFFVFRAAVLIGFTYAKNRVAHNAGARLSARLMVGYLRLPYAFHLRRSSAELVRNAQQSVDDLSRHCFLQLLYVMSESATVIGLLVVLVIAAPGATLIAIAFVGTAALVLLMIVQPRLKRLGGRVQATRKTTLAFLQQSLHGVRDIKLLGVESQFGRLFRHDRNRLARGLYLRGTMQDLPRHVMELALLGFILLLLAISLSAGVHSDQLVSLLGLFAYAGLRMQPSLQKIVSGLNNLKFSAPAVDDIYNDLQLIELAEAPTDTGGYTHSFVEELRFDNVSFWYEQTDRPALAHIDLVIRPGEAVGICGPTGGGKTTLTDLLTGVLEPTQGRVMVDGVELQRNLPSWYEKLGVVPQMIFLTDDTLRRNIALGVPDEQIDEQAVAEAVRLAQLESFVESLPDGLNTVVGERGVRVSGGQRQRVAIARALYRRPQILVLDEGTSALDNATETVLMSSLERLRGRHTVVMVAHRLSTVRTCDRLLYVEAGRIAADGTYETLLAESEGFRALARREQGGLNELSLRHATLEEAGEARQ